MGLRAKIRQNATPLLGAGEQIQAVIPAQLGQPGPRPGLSRKLVLIVADRRILVCERAVFKRSVVRKLLHELPRDTEIGPAHGLYGYAFHLPDRPTIPIWIPRQFFTDVTQADESRLRATVS